MRVATRESVAPTASQRHNGYYTCPIHPSSLMPPEKTGHETPAPPAQPEELRTKENSSWLRRRSVLAGIVIIILLLVVGIILANRPHTAFSPEQIALTPITSNASWMPYEQDFDSVTMVLVPAGVS